MLFFSTFKKALKELFDRKLDYLFLFLQLVVLSDLVVHFLADVFLYINFSVSLILVLLKKRLKVNMVIGFLFGFMIIALIPVLMWGMDINLYGGYVLRLSTSIFVILYFRYSFFYLYENLLFVLAYIAIFFFILQQFVPQFFEVFEPISRFLSNPENHNIGKRYFLIYFYRADYPLRNSGFMWEPAAFGGVLTWAILFNLYLNKFELNKKLYVLLIAGISAFSIGFFTYLSLIMLLYFLQKNKKAIKYFLALLIILLGVSQVPIVKQNIEVMTFKIESEGIRHIPSALDPERDATEFSRVGGFIVNGKKFLEWPFGYGVVERKGQFKFVGVSSNSLMKILVQWGVFGFIVLIYSVRRLSLFLKAWLYPNLNSLGIILTVVIIFGPFIGNPFSKQPLSFAILFFGLFLNKSILKNLKML